MKKLQLVLTNPCTQNWEQMSPVNDGRYCDSCEKKVVDLTLKSDAEVIAFFKKKKSNVCGRLLSTQLHRELAVPPQKKQLVLAIAHCFWHECFCFGQGIGVEASCDSE